MLKKLLFVLLAIFVLLSTSCGEKMPKDFVFVEGGTFRMGIELSDEYWNNYYLNGYSLSEIKEKLERELSRYGVTWPAPFVAHTVKLNNFYICKHEVTQTEYTEIMGENPSSDKSNGNFPVGNVTWFKAVEYCNKRSEKEGLTPCYTENGALCNFTANGYRLPTEAEWEFAARGGNKSKGYEYSGSNNLSEIVWGEYKYEKLETKVWTGNEWISEYKDIKTFEYDDKYHEVMTKAPNELGIFDMTGSVHEWCWDFYKFWWIGDEPIENPIGPKYNESAHASMLTGGYFSYEEDFQFGYGRVNRSGDNVADRDFRARPREAGFRVVRSF